MSTRVRADQIQGSSTNQTLLDRLNEIKHIKPPVATETDLPLTGDDGEQRLIKGTNKMVRFNSTSGAWETVSKTSVGEGLVQSGDTISVAPSTYVKGSHSMTVSGTAPASPASGDLWIEIY